jgi:hypothetical protein
MGYAAKGIALDDVRASQQHQALRQQLHERFDQWLDALERLLLVCLDLRTGYLLLEEVADDRTYATWQALVEERLKALGAHVLYVVSDRAKALGQLAETGLECLSMPDFFHVVHDIVPVIPPKSNRRVPLDYDKALYKFSNSNFGFALDSQLLMEVDCV